LLAGPTQAQDWIKDIQYTEETGTSGIDSVYAGEWEYMVGGGAASFDCNDDGFPDLFTAGGEAKAKFYLNRSKRGGPLQFSVHQSGLEVDKSTGAYPIDIDGDGTMDLVILRIGENIVMRGLGGCRFERANEAWAFEGGDAWSAALAATWEKDAQWPTIAIGNYVNRLEEFSPWGSCTDNWLHRPVAQDRRFAPPLPLTPSYCPLSMLFTDWNNSGTPSLRVSNDREYYEGGQEQLWRIEPGKAPTLYTQQDGWKYLRIWGMGIATSDLDADGFPEYFLTSMADQKLQTLEEPSSPGEPRKPSYKDIAYARGVTAHRPYMGEDLKPSTGWHAQFEDVNNDGLADIFIAKGNVAEMPDFAARDPNNLLIQGPDGKFIEAGGTSGVGSGAISRGAVMADFNLDGLTDLVVVNRWTKAQVWRNTSRQTGHWLQVKLAQSGANRDAVGSRVEITCDGRTLSREVFVGGGHASGQAGWVHVGLGAELHPKLRVRWPDGEWSEEMAVDADTFYVIDRTEGTASVWTPG
jgi:hypothetical protein